MSTISAGQLMEYAEKEALNAVTLKTQSPAAGTVYLALLTNAASGSLDNTWLTMASATEYGATSYARQSAAQNAATSASPSVISNSATVTWGPFTSSPGTSIPWAMMCDASSGTTANLIIAYLMGTARTPISGDSLQAAASGFTAQV